MMNLDEGCTILSQAFPDTIVKVTKPPVYISSLLISHQEDPIILVYKEGQPLNIDHKNGFSVTDISGLDNSLHDLSLTGQPLECPFGNDDDLDDTVTMDPVVLTEESFHAPLSMKEARKVLSTVTMKMGPLPAPVWVLCDTSDALKHFLLSTVVESSHWRTISWATAHSLQTEKIAIKEMLDKFEETFKITSGYKQTSEVCCVFKIDYPGIPKHSKCYLEAKWKKPSYEVPVNQADTTLIVDCSVGQAESQISRWWDQLIHLHKYIEMIKEWKQSQVVQVTYQRDGMKLPSFNSSTEEAGKREALSERLTELLQSSDSMSVCRQLDNHVNLTSVLNSTIHELLTDKQKGQDFTDRLWSLLIEAETYQELKESFRLVIREVRKQSIKPYIFAKNRTRLASLLRNIKSSSSDVEFMMEPLELLVEMGLEKLKRDYMFMFLASNITNMQNLSAPDLPSFSEVPSHEWQSAVDTWLTWLSQLHTVLELVSVIHTTMDVPIIMQFTGLALSKFVSPNSLVQSFTHLVNNRSYQMRAPVITKEVKTFIEGDKIFYKWMLKLTAESKFRRASSTYVLLEQSPLPQQISLIVQEKSLNETDILSETAGLISATEIQEIQDKYTYIELSSISDKIMC
ncbi:protein zwilch homolog [Macrosteles quadrilineatus]|uniref:protein zwilch homolog n=1 Tax=Macrosteles quadrilineatus TaxID=74068 RepID=UPI0023E13B8A|nr:protein zwilch homolog [Macrosteles quadrilineatus]